MRIGLIGTGLMGYPMAQKILENNFRLTVFNRSKKKAVPLQSLGAEIAENATEVFKHSDVIILMLSDFTAIKEVLYEKTVQNEINNECILQMSTISPLQNKELNNFCKMNECEYLEAPVLGSINEVKNKNLIVLAGGKQEKFEKYLPVFKVFGKSVYYIGEVGKASALKLALNQLIASLTAAFSVSLSYVKKNEIDTDLFMDILRKSALYAPTFDKKLSNYEIQNFDKTNFPLQHMLKDVRLVKDEAGRFNIDSGMLKAIEQVIINALDKGYKNKDYSSMYMSIFDKR